MGRKRQLTKESVLQAIQRTFLDHGVAPTIEELRVLLKVGSTRTVLRYLDWLERDGDIERRPGARSIRLRRQAEGGIETVSIPIVGTAPAGPLMLAEQNIEGWVQLPKEILSSPRVPHFLLRVRGDSMNRARVAGTTIENDDLVLVRQQATADPGEIVVALVDGSGTIKRLVKGPGYWILKPESKNPKNKPIVVNEEFHIQGVIKKVLKKGSKLLT
jgi:repressor LexA